MLRVCAWLCTKGYMPCRQDLHKRWFAGEPGKRALWVKLVKMVDVPGVAHWNGIFGLQMDRARPGDSRYPIRAFPLWRQLVGILGRLNAPKNKVAFLKAMVAAQGLLVARCSHSRPKTIFLKERCIILPQPLLCKLVLSEHSR